MLWRVWVRGCRLTRCIDSTLVYYHHFFVVASVRLGSPRWLSETLRRCATLFHPIPGATSSTTRSVGRSVSNLRAAAPSHTNHLARHLPQLQHHLPTALINASADPASAPVGIDPHCGISRVGSDHSLANIANIIACGVSIFFVIALVFWTSRRRAAVGEFAFHHVYVVTLFWHFVTCRDGRMGSRGLAGRSEMLEREEHGA